MAGGYQTYEDAGCWRGKDREKVLDYRRASRKPTTFLVLA